VAQTRACRPQGGLRRRPAAWLRRLRQLRVLLRPKAGDLLGLLVRVGVATGAGGATMLRGAGVIPPAAGTHEFVPRGRLEVVLRGPRC